MTTLATGATTWTCRAPYCDTELTRPCGHGDGYCGPCHGRWYRAGCPESGPPRRKGAAPSRARDETAARAAIESWYGQAACAGMDTDLFFPPGPDSLVDPAAVAACASCPVRTQCLEFALSHPQQAKHGYWGGMTESERAAERRNAKRRVGSGRDGVAA